MKTLHPSDRDILETAAQRLNANANYLVTSPLSESEIESLADTLGLPMPPGLEWYLAHIGLFTDLGGGPDGQMLENREDYEKEHDFISRLLGDHEHPYFPFGHDGAGNAFAVDTRDGRSVVLADHDRGCALDLDRSFAEWFSTLLDSALSRDLYPNSEKSWQVQFALDAVNEHAIFDVLRDAGYEVSLITDWSEPSRSPAGVESNNCEFAIDAETFELKRQRYSDWSTPKFYFNMSEPIDSSEDTSRLEQLCAVFEAFQLDFALVDYGIMPDAFSDK